MTNIKLKDRRCKQTRRMKDMEVNNGAVTVFFLSAKSKLRCRRGLRIHVFTICIRLACYSQRHERMKKIRD